MIVSKSTNGQEMRSSTLPDKRKSKKFISDVQTIRYDQFKRAFKKKKNAFLMSR